MPDKVTPRREFIKCAGGRPRSLLKSVLVYTKKSEKRRIVNVRNNPRFISTYILVLNSYGSFPFNATYEESP